MRSRISPCGLVRESDSENAVDRHALLGYQPSHTMRQHPRLARTRTSEDQRIAKRRGHSRALRLVETADYFAALHAQ